MVNIGAELLKSSDEFLINGAILPLLEDKTIKDPLSNIVRILEQSKNSVDIANLAIILYDTIHFKKDELYLSKFNESIVDLPLWQIYVRLLQLSGMSISKNCPKVIINSAEWEKVLCKRKFSTVIKEKFQVEIPNLDLFMSITFKEVLINFLLEMHETFNKNNLLYFFDDANQFISVRDLVVTAADYWGFDIEEVENDIVYQILRVMGKKTLRVQSLQ